MDAFIYEYVVLTGGWFTLPAFLIALYCERKQHHGITLVLGVMGMLIMMAHLKPSGSTLLCAILVYLPLGVCWSFLRWKRYCNDIVRRCDQIASDREHFDEVLEMRANLDASSKIQKERIVIWGLIWPLSVLETLLKGPIDRMERAVLNLTRFTYAHTADEARKKVQAKLDEM